ncbi:hypothetical protein A3715_19090 [Oleiphilus sp. HI0009]|nr:hypothetical protein A3715_19090 [Oleiphilus sp. HI0009]
MNKKQFLLGAQCSKALYLNNNFDVLSEEYEFVNSLREQSIEVEDLCAQVHFPDAIINPDLDLLSKAQSGQQFRHVTFSKHGWSTTVDFVVKQDDGFVLYESVLGSKPEQQYIDEISYSVKLARDCGITVSEANLVMVDTSSVWPDKQSFFVIEDVTYLASSYEERITNIQSNLIDVVLLDAEPDQQIGSHCKKPTTCPYKSHCNKSDSPTIFDIPRLSKKKEAVLRESGITYISDMSFDAWEDYSLTTNQNAVVRTILTQEEFIDYDAVSEEIDSWAYPHIYLDFETDNKAIPMFEGLHPFEQVPFQYSMTIVFEDGSEVKRGFFHADSSDPRQAFAKSLSMHLDEFGVGTLIAYYASFEKSVMNRLCHHVPEVEKTFKLALTKLEDLFVVVKNNVRHHAFKGSYSLKSVLPVLVPELDYSDLELRNGTDAQLNFRRILNQEVVDDALVQNAIAYCDRDVEAMVRIKDVLTPNGAAV